MASNAFRRQVFRRAVFREIYPAEDSLFILQSRPIRKRTTDTFYFHAHSVPFIKYLRQCFGFGCGFSLLDRCLGNMFGLKKRLSHLLFMPIILLLGGVVYYHRKRLLSIHKKYGLRVMLGSTVLYHIKFILGTIGYFYGWFFWKKEVK